MTYELAKELKDAGFPKSESWIDNGSSFWIDNGELCWEVPTLSELIEACGDGFVILERYSSAEYGCMEPIQVYDGGNPLEEITHGKTPEEAVARLWLALNKK